MSKSNPLVSIIMNCHNGEKFLTESLKSVKNQTYKNWELIFYDNCSTDKSKNIIKNFSDKRVRYFKSQKILKLYHARNKAIEKSKGKYICFLDVDYTWAKNKLNYQINNIQKHNSQILYSNYYINNEKKKTKYLRSNYILPKGRITQNLLNDYCIGILTALINKEIFKKNKFNKRFDIIGDFDFFIRLSMNYKIFAINKPLATYRYHSTNLSKLKINIHLRELKLWLKENNSNLKKYNLLNFKINIFKIKIKNFFNT